MAFEGDFAVSAQDLENPAGLARLGFKFLSTVSPDGDRELAAMILDAYNEHELIMAVMAAATIMARSAAESEGVSIQEAISHFIAMPIDPPTEPLS